MVAVLAQWDFRWWSEDYVLEILGGVLVEVTLEPVDQAIGLVLSVSTVPWSCLSSRGSVLPDGVVENVTREQR